MLKIAHRGNIDGPSTLENSPDHLNKALSLGYDVEVDVWIIGEEIFFGHDTPTWGPIPDSYLVSIKDSAWFHCKNLEALNTFISKYPDMKFFWHESDSYTLTSNLYIWTYPGEKVTNRSIIVSLDGSAPSGSPYAMCSDNFLQIDDSNEL